MVHVFSAHAPHEADEFDVKVDFCEKLTSLVCSVRRKGRRAIVLIDANARIGSVESAFIGDRDIEKENANGYQLVGTPKIRQHGFKLEPQPEIESNLAQTSASQ